MADSNELQGKLKVLCDAYAAQLPEKLKQLEQAWRHFARDSWDDEGMESLYRMVHGLTGSGKTFGFSLLSDVARNLEEYLKQLAQVKAVMTEHQRSHIEGIISELHQVTLLRDAPADYPLVPAVLPSQNMARLKHILVVDEDCVQAEELRTQLCYFGYEVSVFNNLDDFQRAVPAISDAVVLMDFNFSGGCRSGVCVIQEIQRGRDIPLQVVFLTAHSEFRSRLEAVRAGSVAFFSKPVNIGSLIDKLDSLTTRSISAPYHVLIVDDSEPLTTYYSTILEQAGMKVRVINNPLDVMVPLYEHIPDLILLDIYMPECNGLELAKVIRQLDAFVSVPIVFLSAESDIDKQLSAMDLGGDDFLTKPIQPEHLISSVASRIQRSLTLRSFMVRDSLTGLFNHTAIQDQLVLEVARANRQGTSLAVAMIDIDYFKRVNDTFGHQAGDRVIKSLSRLLKQRLRETDVVGRYGGEEFVVILSNVDGKAAVEVLNAIRNDFSRLYHYAEGKEFSVTFSCGIADVSCFSDALQLGEAADSALYKAKHLGRNQIVLAEASSSMAVLSRSCRV